VSDTIFAQTLNTNGDGQNGFTRVAGFAVAALTLPPGNIARVRFTLQAGTTQAITLSGAHVGHAAAAGDAYDFLATPVQLLFAGSGSKVIAANTSEVTDWATFAYNKTSALLMAWNCNGGTGSDMARYASSVSNVTDYFKAAVNEPATVNKTGYTAQGGICILVNKIEVETVENNFFFIFR